MKEHRFNYFCNLTDEEKSKLTFDDFTVSEIKELLDETSLRKDDRTIATERFIECKSVQEIADKLYIDFKTCTSRIAKIEQKLKGTCFKFFKK